MGEALEIEYFDGQKKALHQLFNQKREMLEKRMDYQYRKEIAIILSEVKAEYAKKKQEFTDNVVEKYNVSIKKVVFCKHLMFFTFTLEHNTNLFIFYKSLFTYYLLHLFALFT